MRRLLSLLVAVLATAPVSAQINLPQLPGVPPVQLPADPAALPGALGSTLQTAARVPATIRVDALLGRHRAELERDPRGAPVMRSVILALSPSPDALVRAQAAGYVVQRDDALDALGERIVTLLVPRGTSTRRALAQLRRLDNQGSYDFDHVYFESTAPPLTESASLPGTGAQHAAVSATAAKIGLVDSGIRRDHPALASLSITQYGCDGKIIPSAHGTAVASLLAGMAPDFSGAAPGAALFVADVYCGDTAPGGRVDEIARALAWLAAQNVGVMNLSLVGPPNVVLEGVIKRVLARSIVVVAAAGNDGPNAKPLYPAAYAGVIAVTAVDARGKALLEAARGPHVAFAAPGADMLAAGVDPDWQRVRGSSFAAPLVAGLIAGRLSAAGAGASPAAIVEALALEAEDLGRKGRDPVYGRGLLGAALRVPPESRGIK